MGLTVDETMQTTNGQFSGFLKRFLVFVALVLLSTIVYFYQKRHAEPIHRELEQEFARIAPVSGATPVRHESTYKAGTSLVQTEYKTTVSFAEIKAHYRAELERNGWYFDSDRNADQNGGWSGFEELIFCKGTYAASLSHRVQNPSDSTFAFALSWGLPVCR